MLKTKIPKIDADMVSDAVQRAGLVAMSAALTLCLLEMPDDAKRAILPMRTVPVWANAGQQGSDTNPIRREREETAPHFISYSEVQRTPTRSGRS